MLTYCSTTGNTPNVITNFGLLTSRIVSVCTFALSLLGRHWMRMNYSLGDLIGTVSARAAQMNCTRKVNRITTTDTHTHTREWESKKGGRKRRWFRIEYTTKRPSTTSKTTMWHRWKIGRAPDFDLSHARAPRSIRIRWHLVLIIILCISLFSVLFLFVCLRIEHVSSFC